MSDEPEQKSPKTFSIAHTLADGSTIKMPMVDLIASQLEQYSKMLTCEDASLRMRGRQKLREIAAILATAENQRLARKVFNPQYAAQPRPGARSKLKKRVVQVMAQGRRDGHSFKDFLSSWETDPLDGLRLTFDRERGKYLIDDENEDSEPGEYAINTLTKLYSGG